MDSTAASWRAAAHTARNRARNGQCRLKSCGRNTSICRLEFGILGPLILSRRDGADRDEGQLVTAWQVTLVRPRAKIEDEIRPLRDTGDAGAAGAGVVVRVGQEGRGRRLVRRGVGS